MPLDRYDLLASAVAGRRVAVLGPTAAERVLAYCDERAIHLSARAEHDEREARLEVVAQALLLAAGSLAPRAVRRLLGRPQAARRYGYLEVRRALTLFAARVPHFFARHPALEAALPPEARTTRVEESADYALDMRKPLGTLPDFVGAVRPLAVLRDHLTQAGRSALTAEQRAGTFRQGPPEAPTSPDDAGDQEDAPGDKLLRLFQNPLLGGNPIASLFGKILGMRAARGGHDPEAGAGAHADTPVARIERVWQRGVHAVKAALPFSAPSAAKDEGAAGSANYPEWDELRGRYRRHWVRVEEVEPWRADGPANLARVLTPAPRELQRRLSTLGLNHEMRRRQLDGTEFDVGRLIDCAIDLRTGHSPSVIDIYRASRKTRRDLGVVIVIDMSSSTEEKNQRGESIFEHHLRAAWHLARTFDRLGDRLALFGFQSWGRKQVHMIRLKGHEEDWNSRIAARFALTEPLGYTRTGAAVRHADQVLRNEMRVPDRLLILITDGLSYDQQYEQHYAEADAAKSLAEARDNGTACVCLCVGGGTGAAQLRQVFGAANLLMVDDSGQITARIRAVCAAALDGVAKRKVRRASSAGE